MKKLTATLSALAIVAAIGIQVISGSGSAQASLNWGAAPRQGGTQASLNWGAAPRQGGTQASLNWGSSPDSLNWGA
jgi:hypothetical protein